MNVTEAVKSRISVRSFLDKPVPEELIREILDISRWSPSGGNVQPWRIHVVTDKGRDRLVETIKQAISKDPLADESEFPMYPPKLPSPWRERRFQIGEDMYELLGIPRDDKPARIAHVMRNYEFFGAPTGIFFSLDRLFNKNQWAHLGMFMQTIALVAEEKGLATCMQESWMTRNNVVSSFLGLAENEELYCGMALGYADPEAKVNALRSARVEVDDFATIISD